MKSSRSINGVLAAIAKVTAGVVSTSAELSPTRSIIGPLTTVFTPPPECSYGYALHWPGDDTTLDSHLTGGYTDCTGTVLQCTPTAAAANPLVRAFYSPGLVCPDGWTTVTIISQGMSNQMGASSILSLMHSDETAAFCCPSGLALDYGTYAAPGWNFPPRCASTILQGKVTYEKCVSGTKNNNSPRRETVDAGTDDIVLTTPDIKSTATVTEPHPEWGVTLTFESYVTSLSAYTTSLESVVTLVFAAQLLWQLTDLPAPPPSEDSGRA